MVWTNSNVCITRHGIVLLLLPGAPALGLYPSLHSLVRSLTYQPQVEISLQPWHAFKPDGVILFSDILTPLTGMNIPFDITAGKGPVIADPIRTREVRVLG
jgi:hypothetical protein